MKGNKIINGTNIYNRIMKLIFLNNIKKKEFYSAIGITRQNLAKWKAGSLPSIDVLYKIKNYFNVSFDYLLLGEENNTNLNNNQKINLKNQIKDMLDLL